MAQAPGHRLGQIIGDTLELAIAPILQSFADGHSLYLDSRGQRPARRGQKVTWHDDLGNAHDLDYVLERGGTNTHVGIPVAFIETAWRRYTKHSRNKAQEIQGAILPLLTTWSKAKPFAGVVLAGEWTQGSLTQLRSHHFSVLHVPYSIIIDVFRRAHIDASYDETTDDSFLQRQIDAWGALDANQREGLGGILRDEVADGLDVFMRELSCTVLRQINSVSVLPLRGSPIECKTVDAAIGFIRAFDAATASPGPIVRFEVIIRYDNGDRVTADFGSANDAVAFLDSFI